MKKANSKERIYIRVGIVYYKPSPRTSKSDKVFHKTVPYEAQRTMIIIPLTGDYVLKNLTVSVLRKKGFRNYFNKTDLSLWIESKRVRTVSEINKQIGQQPDLSSY